MEEQIRAISHDVTSGLWKLYNDSLQQQAETVARPCPCCGQRREKNKTGNPLRITVMGLVVLFFAAYYHCRRCKRGESPVRQWLGVTDRGSTLAFERSLTDLTTRMTFGDAVDSLFEQHGLRPFLDPFLDTPRCSPIVRALFRHS